MITKYDIQQFCERQANMSCISCIFYTISAVIFTAGVTLKLYLKLTLKRNGCYTSLVGKTVVVTGANTGIGYTTALDFAMRGARVILACRDKVKAERARQNITKATGNDNVVVKLIDMQSFESVRAFAKDINESEERIDILVNNAAAMGLGNRVTKDGLQIVMQTNHFSPFLLTHLLLDKLKFSAPSRIVNVSSLMAKYEYYMDLDVENLNKYPEGSEASAESALYANSKLCNIFFSTELAKRLEGTGVSVNCLHPGTIRTEITRNMSRFRKIFFSFISNLFFLTPEEGAQTTIYVALSNEAGRVSGELFSNCQQVEMYKSGQNIVAAKKVWKKSEEFVKLGDGKND